MAGYGLVTSGVAAGGVAKPLTAGAIGQDLLHLTRGLGAFLPCCAAVVPPDPELRRRGDPPPPPRDRLAVAQAEPRLAGPAGTGLPAKRRDLRGPGRRVRDQHRNGLAVCERDGRAAVRAGYGRICSSGGVLWVAAPTETGTALSMFL